MFNPFARATKFQKYFRCFPVAMLPGTERDSLNYGGKIVMPPSALHALTMLNISYPMLFRIKKDGDSDMEVDDDMSETFGGVLEFIAEEGRVYLPQWMMQTLKISPGTIVVIESTDLPLGRFVKIEPQSVAFLDISDPKAVLENALRNFTTLTVGDVFEIRYNDHVYGIKVLEVQPDTDSHSVCVVETDLEVDFAPPVGYVEPQMGASSAGSLASSSRPASVAPSGLATPVGTMAREIGYDQLVARAKPASAFTGPGQKLSGRAVKTDETEPAPDTPAALPSTDAPPLTLPFGQLFFGFPVIPVKPKDDDTAGPSAPSAFAGQGQSLRQSRKRVNQSSARPESKRSAPNSPEVVEID